MTKPRKSLQQMAAEAAGRFDDKGNVYMACSICGCRDLLVMRSVPSADGESILRTRYCRVCGRNGPRFYTSETIVKTK